VTDVGAFVATEEDPARAFRAPMAPYDPYYLPPPEYPEARATPRPAPATQPASENIAAWMASPYATGQGLARGGLAAADSKYGEAASELAPMALGAFVPLPGIKRLEAAGLRERGGWGSSDALRKAEELWTKSPALTPSPDVWRETGWTPGHTWGMDARGCITAPPVSYVSTEHMDLQRPTHFGIKGDPAWQGPWKRVVGGIDDLLTADPQLANIPTFAVTNGAGKYSGGNRPNRNLHNLNSPLSGPPLAIEATAPDQQALRSILAHEQDHALEGAPLPNGLWRAGDKPIYGTRAQKLAQERVAQLRGQLNDLTAKPYSKAEADALRAQIDDWDEKARYIAPQTADYFNSRWERRAREAAMRFLKPFTEQKDIIPGQVDTYAADAFLPDFEQRWPGIPPEAFKP
jgi:hypothetical protein